MSESTWVYILECADGSLYTGCSHDPIGRTRQHNDGLLPKAYTFNRRPVTLVWVQEFPETNQALEAEKKVKKWSRHKKLALIDQDIERLKMLSRKRKKAPTEPSEA